MHAQEPSFGTLADSLGLLMAANLLWESEMVFKRPRLERRAGKYEPKLIGSDTETLTIKTALRELVRARSLTNIRTSLTRG